LTFIQLPVSGPARHPGENPAEGRGSVGGENEAAVAAAMAAESIFNAAQNFGKKTTSRL
jgi:hypothetical protein